MKLSIEQVRHVARLARLRLSPDEEQRYLRQLSEVLEHAGRLAELDTSQVPPTAYALFGGAGAPPSIRDGAPPSIRDGAPPSIPDGAPSSIPDSSPPCLREDVVLPSLPPELAVANAPAREDSAIAVPKIID